jgi:hypothetical protein
MRFLKILLVILTLLAANAALAGTLAPKCDPTLPPSFKGACGLPAFVDFIRNIISQVFVIIIPLAVIFIIWGGFVIMTAGGSPERVKKGKEIILIALTGLIIALGSWLILTTISKVFFQEPFQLR